MFLVEEMIYGPRFLPPVTPPFPEPLVVSMQLAGEPMESTFLSHLPELVLGALAAP